MERGVPLKTKKLNLTQNQKIFVRDFVRALKNNEAAIFAGAGLSIPSGMMSWNELLHDAAEELELKKDSITDMATLAQYYQNHRGTRLDVAQLIMDSISQYAEPNENQKLIAQLPIETVWTTNYDDLLERAYRSAFKSTSVKISPKDFSLSNGKKDVTIYKMHGDKTQPTEAVITKNDYETYNDTHLVYTTALKGDLVEKKFLFIGFSFEDPNLDYILARIKALVGENQPTHYFFIEEVKQKKDESENDFNLRKKIQELKIRDLKRYGITAVLLNSYNDISEILSIIKRMSGVNNIFLSGAQEFPDGEVDSDSEQLFNQLVKKITKGIVSKRNKIISGFGQGVGSLVINTVLEEVSNNQWFKLDDKLKIYPFPQNKNTNWAMYRKEILKNVGISIFLFGEKKSKNGDIVISDGMLEEFQIAHEYGIKILPLGCTGGASKKIFEMVLEKPHEYYGNDLELIEMIRNLGNHDFKNSDDVTSVANLTLEIVSKIQKLKGDS